MRFEVLGPVRAVDGARVLGPVSDLRRLLLAVLLVRANRTVGSDLLAEVMWGDAPPERPDKSLQIHVHRLRQVLDSPDRLTGVPGGYALQVGPGEMDAADFESFHVDARLAHERGDLDAAVAAARAGLELWRGAPYADVDDGLVVAPEARRLAESRLIATEELYEAELSRGRSREVVPELTELVAEFPLRERFVAHLMLALYRSGRQARALTAFRAARQRLGKELGAEPGRELRELHDAIQAEDPDLLHGLPGVGPGASPGGGARSRPVLPSQLPPMPGAFVGRQAELAELASVTASDDAAAVLVTGMAGVGKTGLMLRHAHDVAPQFGDGQLYVDLRGHSAEPALEPIEALGHLLRGLGVDPGQVGTSVEGATAEFRSRVAGRKMLVVLDNAASAEQVRPLMPATPECMTLITSRNRLPGLVAREGVHRIGLAVLPGDDAQALVSDLIGPERSTDDPQAVAALADACAGLPLALRIAAAQLADEPHRSVVDYLAEFRERGLDTLVLDDDEHAAVASAFDLSYQRLDQDARVMFRLLGIVPGLDVTVDAAAALSGTTYDAARQSLRRLTRAHLLEEHAAGRYRFHDLLRVYARHRVENEESDAQRRAARERLFTWYYQGKEAAEALLRWHSRDPPRPVLAPGVGQLTFTDERAAAVWLQGECHNIVDAAREAAGAEDSAHWSWHLVLGLVIPMARRGFLTEALALLPAAVEAARAANDRHAIAHTLTELGAVETLAGTPPPDELVAEALDHAESVGDYSVQGYCLYMAGVVQERGNQHARAEDLLTRSVAAFGEVGDHGGEGLALNQLGGLAQSRGELRRAVRWWEQGLELAERPLSRMSALINLSWTRPMLGELDGIEEMMDEAELLVARYDEQAAACNMMQTRAELYRNLGRAQDALGLLVTAKRLSVELGIPRLRADTGVELGFVHLALGDVDAALRAFTEAADIADAGGLRGEGSYAVRGLAEAQFAAGDPAAAEPLASEAIALAGDDHRVHRADAFVTLARIELASGRVDDAVGHGEEALAIHRRTEHHLGQARAHRIIGEALLASGDETVAVQGADHLREALRRFETFGSPEGADVRVALAGCDAPTGT